MTDYFNNCSLSHVTANIYIVAVFDNIVLRRNLYTTNVLFIFIIFLKQIAIFVSVDSWETFVRGIATETWSRTLTLSSVAVKNSKNYTSTLQHASMSWCLHQQRIVLHELRHHISNIILLYIETNLYNYRHCCKLQYAAFYTTIILNVTESAVCQHLLRCCKVCLTSQSRTFC